MTDDRIRDISHTISAKPRAIGKVDVLVRREEVLVEPAQLVEQGFRHQAGRAAHAEDLQRLRRLGGRHSVQPLEGAASTKRKPSPALSIICVHVDDARRRQCKAAGPIEPANKRPQPSRIGNRVVVQKRHDRRACLCNASAVSTGESAVLRQCDDADRRVPAADMVHRACR